MCSLELVFSKRSYMRINSTWRSITENTRLFFNNGGVVVLN